MTPDYQLQLARIRWGMDVCDSEQATIGTIHKVYRGADYGEPPPEAAPKVVEPYLNVKTPDHRDLFIPVGSINRITDDCVVLNVPHGRLDQMGWDQQPSFLQNATTA